MRNEHYLEERQLVLTEVVNTSLTLVLITILLILWLWVWFSISYASTLPMDAFIACFFICSLCICTHCLRKVHFRTAVYGFLIGLWSCNVWAVLHYDVLFFLYLFSLISLITYVLSNPAMAVISTILSSIFILIQLDGKWNWTIVPALLLMWLVLIISFIVFGKLYEALYIAWQYGDYAVQQMRDAREHRAELVRLTKALTDTQQNLEYANMQLLHTRNAAEEARRLKVLFAANVSHELRTPINLIVGFSELIITAPKSYGVALPSAYWTDVNIVYRNAKHLQSLINDVLDISQVDAGQMSISRESVNPATVILEAVELVQESITRQGLHTEVAVPEQLPVMWIDRIRIRQVILNLLSNAMRFTQKGTISLKAKIEATSLHISVADTGVGISKEDLHRVFEEFHQLGNSLSSYNDGSGLGLTLSKQFVEMHGGKIWVESEGIAGMGSTFTFSLPLSNPSSSWRFPSSVKHSSSKGQSQSIVVFVDDPAIIHLFERYARNFQIIGSNDLEDAIALVKKIQPAAFIVDSKQSDSDFINRLCELGIKTPIIPCPMPSSLHILRQYGVADYLVKPVTRQTLLDALTKLEISIKRILIVDDEPNIVRMFSRMLDGVEPAYQIWKAYNGREGLLLMEEWLPDAVILDVLMPEVDGFGVIEHMKKHPHLSNIPIVLTSARGAFDTFTPTAEGAISVVKPSGFQPIEIIQTVEAVVSSLIPTIELRH